MMKEHLPNIVKLFPEPVWPLRKCKINKMLTIERVKCKCTVYKPLPLPLTEYLYKKKILLQVKNKSETKVSFKIIEDHLIATLKTQC